MVTSKSVFVKTNSGAKNMALGSSVIASDERLVVLDKNCNVIHYEKGEGAGELFERIAKSVKPAKGETLLLENGSWIDVESIGSVYISAKSNSLLISAVKNDNLLAMFTSEEYQDLQGLCDVLADALCEFSEGEPMPKVNWSEYKA